MSLDSQLIKWRIGPRVGGMYQLLAYIDARTAMNELDEKDPAWSTVKPEPVYEDGKVVAFIHGITVDGVTRYDIGHTTNMEKYKGGVSDAFKRTAQTFGIGRELYDQPRVFVPDKDSPLRPRFNQVTGRWEIDPPGFVQYPDDPDEPERETNEDKVRTIAKEMGLKKDDLKEVAGGQGIVWDPQTLTEDQWGRIFTALVARRTGGSVVTE